MVSSVLAAMLGVQSEKHRLRDFSAGQSWPYLLLGWVATLGFVLLVILLVRWALSIAGV